MNEFQPYTDNWGCIIGHKEDAGDSFPRTMMKALGEYWMGKRKFPPTNLSSPFWDDRTGLYRRHPSNGWWSDLDRMSRDQLTPLLVLFGLFPKTKIIRISKYERSHFWPRLLKRFGFFWNTRENGATKKNHGEEKGWHYAKWWERLIGRPKKVIEYRSYHWKPPDWAGPNTWALYFRYKNWKLPLYICDGFLFLNAISRRYTSDRDPLNYLIRTRYADRKNRTFWSSLIERIEDKEDLDADLKYYFNRVGLMPMYDLWKGLI